MKKKGFTLIEMLAAVVILGLLSSIAVLAVGRILDNTRKKEAKKIEEELASLGDIIYMHEKISKPESEFIKLYKSKCFSIEVSQLKASGYLEEVFKSPYSGTCDGYLHYDFYNKKFNGYIFCGFDKYITAGFTDSHCGTDKLNWDQSNEKWILVQPEN